MYKNSAGTVYHRTNGVVSYYDWYIVRLGSSPNGSRLLFNVSRLLLVSLFEPHAMVQTTLADQLFMGALFHDSAIFEYQNQVCSTTVQ